MVNFWPFKSSEDAASFEKTLSTLTAKINRAAARNDASRQRARRVRVMWTLYAGFAYILAALLLILVTGWRSWGATEISVVAGGPVLIYLVRTSLTTYYDYRISNTQKYLETLNKERDATIERLKAATKYNSTQQLLEKYGSSPKTKAGASPGSGKKPQGQPKPPQPAGPRTTLPPPPTANIQRAPTQPSAGSQRPPSAPSSPQGPAQGFPLPATTDAPSAEFAPNAYDANELTRQYSSTTATTFTQTHWYDRIMDALLGEDETQPKNRLALICSQCRLVNGQAPPGTRSLEDVGRWRCGGCHAWNGKEKPKEDVITGLVQNWEAERLAREKGVVRDEEESDEEAEQDEGEMAGAGEEAVEAELPPSRSTRSKSKAKSKK